MQTTIRCEECGKFCVPANSGTYYGGVLDIEPPDPVFFCQKCVYKFLTNTDKIIEGCWWIKPEFISIKNSILRNIKS